MHLLSLQVMLGMLLQMVHPDCTPGHHRGNTVRALILKAFAEAEADRAGEELQAAWMAEVAAYQCHQRQEPIVQLMRLRKTSCLVLL
mmetsp:Transcript_66751/g.118099  ORF Transcript_66751/g.118099 Transcript_66751/m.118099 type:complete len:87 (+) Transcript_66751:1332-1592(+)